MDDPRLSTQLRALEQPVAADPAFLDRLFEQLVEEAGLRPARSRTEAPEPAVGRVQARRRGRRWPFFLLVAAVAVGGSLAAVAGGFLLRNDRSAADVPDLCALLATADISAIVGAPVTLVSAGSSSPAPFGSCGYTMPPPRPGVLAQNLEFWISRPPDLAIAWSAFQDAKGGTPVDGIGDAAVFFVAPTSSPYVTLYVLRAPYVLSVGYLEEGGAAVGRQQLEDLARLIVARL